MVDSSYTVCSVPFFFIVLTHSKQILIRFSALMGDRSLCPTYKQSSCPIYKRKQNSSCPTYKHRKYVPKCKCLQNLCAIYKITDRAPLALDVFPSRTRHSLQKTWRQMTVSSVFRKLRVLLISDVSLHPSTCFSWLRHHTPVTWSCFSDLT